MEVVTAAGAGDGLSIKEQVQYATYDSFHGGGGVARHSGFGPGAADGTGAGQNDVDPFGAAFRAELGGSAAWARQSFVVPQQGQPVQEDERGLFVAAPEAMLQVSFGVGGVAPYIGVGGGITLDRAERQDGSTVGPDFGPSAAVGVRTLMANQVGLVAEVRGRAVGMDFDRRTTELSLGLSWSLKPTPYLF
jgi:hypothetical protein